MSVAKRFVFALACEIRGIEWVRQLGRRIVGRERGLVCLAKLGGSTQDGVTLFG